MKSVPPRQNSSAPRRKTLGKAVGNPSYGTNEQDWDKLVELGFFPACPTCKFCNRPLVVRTYRPRLHFSVKCTNPDCKKYTGLLDGTHLWHVNNIRNFFAAATTFVSNSKVCVLYAQTTLAAKTWADYKFRLQTTVNQTLERMKAEGRMKLGGEGKIVEVDECKLHSSKYHKGHPPASDDIWVVGVIERERDATGLRRSAFMMTDRLPSKVLVPFIKEWVAEHSILISDGWKGYTDELEQHYFRDVVEHKTEFAHKAVVDGKEINSNTNHIEREWVEVRKVMAHKDVDAYQDELNKEVFRLLFLAGKDTEEQAYTIMEKMAELKN